MAEEEEEEALEEEVGEEEPQGVAHEEDIQDIPLNTVEPHLLTGPKQEKGMILMTDLQLEIMIEHQLEHRQGMKMSTEDEMTTMKTGM